MQSPIDDYGDNTTLMCRNIPRSLNKRILLRQHFEKFGVVKNVQVNVEEGLAMVEFENHQQAAHAKNLGASYSGAEIVIRWRRQSVARRSSSGSGMQAHAKQVLQTAKNTLHSETAKPLFGKQVKLFGKSFSPEISIREPVKQDLYDDLPPPSDWTEDSHSNFAQSKPTALFGKQPTLFGKQAGNIKREASPSLFGKMAGSEVKTNNQPENDKSGFKPQVFTTNQSLSHRNASSLFNRMPSPKPQNEQQPLSTISSTGSTECEWYMPASMQGLSQTPAVTCSERQAILEKREKIIRQGISKVNDITRAKATKGCCPDMCPERERYLREERRRVHMYEMIPGTESQPQIDHARAVKEYSRSSADQEEPLSLELRPVSVLSRTMEYLCNNIMDVGNDSSWGEWFDFLWNRTRAIRKDITQQHLCSPEAASLVEKCVRFHIFCGERLVEEEARNFDMKINDENLTKCLQTLKEMYSDLYKKGIICPNEAEFRAYVVLMNLNEGDTLREVQQLRPEVRNSSEITFALSIYSALNEKNYIRFFRLVHQTTFFNACILHRYFTQIRHEALKIMLKSYSASRTNTMSCGELAKLLRFEGNEDASDFLQLYGISFNENNSMLDKDSYSLPETSLPPRRAPNLVERKLTTSLGAAIYGGPLPANILRSPTCSFSEEGYFIGIIKQSDVSEMDNTKEIETTSAEIQKTSVLPSLNEIPHEVVTDTVKEICLEVIDKLLIAICRETVEDEKMYIMSCGLVVEEITLEMVLQINREIASDILKELSVERKARERAEQQMVLVNSIPDAATFIIDEVVNEFSAEIANDTFVETRNELQRQLVSKCTTDVCDQLIEEFVHDMSKNVAASVYQMDVTNRLKFLDQMENQVKRRRLRRLLTRWKDVYDNHTKLRKIMAGFPAAPPVAPPKRSLEFQITPDSIILGKRSRVTLSEPKEVNLSISLAVLQTKLSLYLSNSPLNMESIAQSALSHNKTVVDYVKLSILTPDPSCQEDTILTSWLTSKFSGHCTSAIANEGKLIFSNYVEVNNDIWSRKINLFIRHFTADELKPVLLTMYGTNAVIYLLPFNTNTDEAYWLKARSDISNLLRSKPRQPAFPLLVISPLEHNPDLIQQKLYIHSLLEQGLINHVRIDKLDSTVEYQPQLIESLHWMMKHIPSVPDLHTESLSFILEKQMDSCFFSPIESMRSLYLNIHPNPQVLIRLYNDALYSLINRLTANSFQEISWPPYEYNPSDRAWNCGDSLKALKHYLLKLKLPDIAMASGDESWRSGCACVFNYAAAVRDKCPSFDASHLYSRVQQHLWQAEVKFKERCRMKYHMVPDEIKPLCANIPWMNIIFDCAEYLLSMADDNKTVIIGPLSSDRAPSSSCVLELDFSNQPTYEETMEIAMKQYIKIWKVDGSCDPITTDHPVLKQYFAGFKSELEEELDASFYQEAALRTALADSDRLNEGIAKKVEEGEPVGHLGVLISAEKNKSQEFETYLLDMLNSLS